MKQKKLKMNNVFFEKYKDISEKSDFKQNHYSKTASGIRKIGLNSIELMKFLAYYDRSYYEKINYYDLMGSILKCSKEIS